MDDRAKEIVTALQQNEYGTTFEGAADIITQQLSALAEKEKLLSEAVEDIERIKWDGLCAACAYSKDNGYVSHDFSDDMCCQCKSYEHWQWKRGGAK